VRLKVSTSLPYQSLFQIIGLATPTDIEIARQATLIPITEVAKKASAPDDALIPCNTSAGLFAHH